MIICKPYRQDATSSIIFAVAFPLFFLYVLYQIHSTSHGDPSIGTISLYVLFGVFIIFPPAALFVSIRTVRFNETYGEIYFERLIGNRILMADQITRIQIKTAMLKNSISSPGGGGEISYLSVKFSTPRESIEVTNFTDISDIVDSLQKANPKIEVIRP